MQELRGAYSRRFSNAAVTADNGNTVANPGSGNSGNVTVTRVVNDPDMGSVAVSTIMTPGTIGTGSNNQSSRFTNTGSNEYARGTVITVKAVAKSGYRFAGWSGSSNLPSSNPGSTFQMTLNSDVRLCANFERIPATYKTVRVSWDENQGNVRASQRMTDGVISVATGTELTLTAAPKTGYDFARWTGINLAGNVQNNQSRSITITVASDLNLTALFEKSASAEPVKPDVDSPVNPGSGGGSGSGSGNSLGTVTTSTTVQKPNGLKAIVKKWWWLIAIVAYVVFFDKKGGK